MRLPQRLSVFILSAFGVLAQALATVGLYAVISYAVSQRTREIGIRMALGADGARVVRLFVAGGLRLVVIGGALGPALALVTAHPLGGLLFEVEKLDPPTFLGVPLVLGIAALLAPYVPARRATRVDSSSVLRTDRVGAARASRLRGVARLTRHGERPGRRPTCRPPALSITCLIPTFARLSLHHKCGCGVAGSTR